MISFQTIDYILENETDVLAFEFEGITDELMNIHFKSWVKVASEMSYSSSSLIKVHK